MTNIQLPHDHGAHPKGLLEDAPSPEEFAELSLLLRQLGDASRLRLFWILCHCEECVINLSAMMGMSSPAVSHHLKQLRTSGLITSRRDGKEVYYRAQNNARARLLHRLIEELVQHICPGVADPAEAFPQKDEPAPEEENSAR